MVSDSLLGENVSPVNIAATVYFPIISSGSVSISAGRLSVPTSTASSMDGCTCAPCGISSFKRITVVFCSRIALKSGVIPKHKAIAITIRIMPIKVLFLAM